LPLLSPERENELKGLFQVFADGIMFALRKSNLLETAPDSRGVRIVDFLRGHAAESIGLPDLARELKLSESRTSLLVKELFGKSFSELLQLERVGRVKQYLAATGLRLHEIAGLCGFYDEFHLSKLFKRHTGLSPREWRNRKRHNMII
jgi:AraC-like DNA-binding protein